MSKFDMLKTGLGLVTHIEAILKHVAQIKGKQNHGKQELMNLPEKKLHLAIYREYFETEDDANYFIKFCNDLYAMKKDQLPPIHTMVVVFKALLPILTSQEMKGNQSHGKPELKKLENDKHFKYAVILKEIFTNKDDALKHLSDADKIKNTSF